MLDDHADGTATPSDPNPAANSGNSENSESSEAASAAPTKPTRKRAAKKVAPAAGAGEDGDQPAKKTAKKAAKTTAKKTAKKTATTADGADEAEPPRKKTARKAAKKAEPAEADQADQSDRSDQSDQSERASVAAVFQTPEAAPAPARRTSKKVAAKATADDQADAEQPGGDSDSESAEAEGGEGTSRRKRRRGGRRRRKGGSEGAEAADETSDSDGSAAEPAEGESTSSRRRRRRRRAGEDDGQGSGQGGDDPANTVTKVRSSRSAADEITAVSGSTRLEAKKQRRREGREAGRRRAPIVSEAEFLARRESVNRVMVIRQRDDVTQIGVLEDNVLVEHYVARESQTSLIGNVYLGRVQNVLPSMEAAFIDIGKGRNAVLYAGEVNWSALGHKDGQPRKIESVLSSGQTVLVQVTKDPVGHKGARLTSQISLAGRFLVYVPDGTTSGISRKLPDTERNRLKTLLKEIVPEHAGVIVRTAAEGASEEELTRDVERLTARWDEIEKAAKGSPPQLLYGEPDLTLKVVRDLFTEDFAKLVIEGDDAWETVQGYVAQVAPDLEDRLERYQPKKDQDVFSAYRIDEQIKKGLDRKVWLPSGGSLVIDRTEAMTVVDVNTGKFTGSGGNLEETVTKNNLEAAEEIVRQLRLRDIGGIIVVDFIDMVLESNRDLVLRRLVECLGRDRTRHQVAEVTSLGLVQMTRKRIGTGLLESFSHDCPTCHGRGVIVEDAPVEPKKSEDEPRRARRGRTRGRSDDVTPEPAKAPSPADIAAMARHHEERHPEPDAGSAEEPEETSETSELPEPHDPDEQVESLDPLETSMAEESAVLDEAEVELERETDAEPQPEARPEARPESQPESQPEPDLTPPAEPEKPVVVTRSRRRAASRPAGPPSTTSAALVDAGPDHDGSDGVATDPAADLATDPAAEATGSAAEPPSLHVPVKRRGARKR
jgi:ribonuclease E